ncbi:MAG: hypothetical protein JW938_05120 [Candidatus Omnitrophica bacterium]|nr:hypothetical protein [Candidatus Omnitrophota bacterium]
MKTKTKIKYEIDPENRLVMNMPGLGRKMAGFRTVAEGTFSVDKRNQLVYTVTGAGIVSEQNVVPAVLLRQGFVEIVASKLQRRRKSRDLGTEVPDKPSAFRDDVKRRGDDMGVRGDDMGVRGDDKAVILSEAKNLGYANNVNGYPGSFASLRSAQDDSEIKGARMAEKYNSPRDGKGLKKIRIKGTWAMDKQHDLIYRLEGTRTKTGLETIKLSGEMITLEGGKIGVALTTKNSRGKETIYVLSLSGTLKVNKYNKLSFDVKRTAGRSDKLELRGKWEINKHHEIIYKYVQGPRKETRSLTLKGHWDVLDRNRIAYMVEGDDETRLEFSVEYGRYDAKKRALVYTLGVGMKPSLRTVILKGKWRVSKKLGLIFEITYRDGAVYSIMFGATCTLTDHTECSARLKTVRGKDLGIEVELKRELFNGAGQAFVRGLASEKACELVAGVGRKW